MTDPNQEFLFYRGDVKLGSVFIVDTDQPYLCGRLEPSERFVEVALLFEQLAENRRKRRTSETHGITQETREARQQLRNEYEALNREIVGPGLRMIDAKTGQLTYEPLDLEMDDRGFWWRGHIWGDGRKLI